MKKTLLSVGLLASLAGCSTTGTEPEGIPVAVALPLTGTFADNGERHQAAMRMALADLEAAGGAAIRPVLVDCGDNMTTAIERLDATLGTWDAPTQKVRAIISSSTACHEATMVYALRQKIPHLEVSSGSDQEEVLGYTAPAMSGLDTSYEFQVRALCNIEAEMTPGYIASRDDIKKVVIIRGSHSHDIMHATTVRAEFPKTDFASKGGVIVNAEDIVVPNNGPYDEGLDKAMALNPDTIYFHLNGDTFNINFLQALERRNEQVKIVTCGMFRKPFVLDPVTPGFIDYIGGRFWFMMRGPAGSPQLTAFKDAYKTFFGKDADTFAASAYDATMLVGLGLASAATQDGAGLRDAIKAAASGGTAFTYGQTTELMAALKAGQDVNYEGASGTLDFHPDLSVPSRFYVEAVEWDAAAQKGKYVELPSPVLYK